MRLSLHLLALASTLSALNAQVPTPAEFLGYELGDRFTRHHNVVDYAKSHGRRFSLAMACRSRRVISKPQAYPNT